MNSQNVKTIFISLLAASALSSPAFCSERDGTGTSGGGDSTSERVRTIKKWFKKKDTGELRRYVGEDLQQIGLIFQTFDAQGKVSTQIKDLISKGLLKDMSEAVYELKSECKDEDGVVRSASTLRTSLFLNPSQPRPSICVNVRKLAQENASYAEVLGLLYHEHARHFGLEDTVDDDFYPIAELVTRNVESGALYVAYNLGQAQHVEKVSGDLLIQHSDQRHFLGLFAASSKPVKIRLIDKSSSCDSSLTSFSAFIESFPNSSRPRQYSEDCSQKSEGSGFDSVSYYACNVAKSYEQIMSEVSLPSITEDDSPRMYFWVNSLIGKPDCDLSFALSLNGNWEKIPVSLNTKTAGNYYSDSASVVLYSVDLTDPE